MISALLPGYAAIVLLGDISGRSTLTSWAADSYLSVITCVTSRSPEARCGPDSTAPPCSLASASGTILTTPSASTAVKPCNRSAESSVGTTSERGTGRDETMLTVPLTFGSTTKVLPVISATARTTASTSALTKLSVTGSSAARAPVPNASAASATRHAAAKATMWRRTGAFAATAARRGPRTSAAECATGGVRSTPVGAPSRPDNCNTRIGTWPWRRRTRHHDAMQRRPRARRKPAEIDRETGSAAGRLLSGIIARSRLAPPPAYRRAA